MNHFTDLGIETIYVSPFFKSPMRDSGYDISNYTDVDPTFGTIQDFEELIREMKKRCTYQFFLLFQILKRAHISNFCKLHTGLKLLIDFVINHSSDAHKWFQQSIKRIDPYTDYYTWKDPKNYNADGSPNPPNNWVKLNVFAFTSKPVICTNLPDYKFT